MLFLLFLGIANGFTQLEYETSFAGFLKKYNKVYEGDEIIYRFGVFKDKMDEIFEHNSQNHSWTMGINQFSDLTAQEFERIYLGYIHRPNRVKNYADLSGLETPNDVDWTTKGAVTPIKDQAQCGSCWAFSTVGSTEAAHFFKTGSLVSLSEQQLVDCSGSYGNQGCNGGLMDNAFKYYLGKGKGAATETSYPYTAKDGSCKSFTVAATISKFTDVKEKDEDALKTALASTPVSVAVDARKWQNYRGGVFDGCGLLHQLDHGVLAVGMTSGESWKIKNSWGTSWGEQGFIRLKIDTNECGLANEPSYPTA
jgi:cathepsin L